MARGTQTLGYPLPNGPTPPSPHSSAGSKSKTGRWVCVTFQGGEAGSIPAWGNQLRQSSKVRCRKIPQPAPRPFESHRTSARAGRNGLSYSRYKRRHFGVSATMPAVTLGVTEGRLRTTIRIHSPERKILTKRTKPLDIELSGLTQSHSRTPCPEHRQSRKKPLKPITRHQSENPRGLSLRGTAMSCLEGAFIDDPISGVATNQR